MASHSLHTAGFLYFAILFKEFKKPWKQQKFPHPPFSSSTLYTLMFSTWTQCVCVSYSPEGSHQDDVSEYSSVSISALDVKKILLR